jgi:hypothetical protein
MMNGRLPIRCEGGPGWVRRFAARIASRGIRRASFFTMICWLFSNASPNALSLAGESVEYPVKLAFLYNFAKFVEWPADSYHDPGAPLEICIVGHDPFSPDSERELRTKTVGGHPVKIVALKPNDTLNLCHMVFVPVTEKDQANKIVKVLKGSNTLTVGESEGFAVLGGIINLTVEGNKVHFEVNRLAADRAGLKISSKLLSLAIIVTERDHRGSS